MYLKKAKRPNGRIYLTIAESVRIKGKNKTRHIETVGFLGSVTFFMGGRQTINNFLRE